MKDQVRVRFAPSPTGPLHIGGVRTALYNYLFARKNNGVFLIRIEDTDQTRFVAGAEKYILDSLKWLGIDYSEGPDKGGPFAPYRQSERKDIYHRYAEELVHKGHAYYAFDTTEELDAMRKNPDKHLSQYNAVTRRQMKNSLSLTGEEIKEFLKTGNNYVIRIKIPEHEHIEFNDMIRGHIIVDSSELDDKVLFKSDGMPTYHLANIVDDYLMKITHVIRGEEWLPSAPLHVLLYRYLGLEEHMPEFAHLPLLLKPDGNGKLSKRDGDRLGFPVFPINWTDPVNSELSSGYREAGYLPDAVVNILALLGWNPGTEQEIFSMDELVSRFSLDHVHKSGAKFDPDKAKWFNHQYIQHTDDKVLYQLLKSFIMLKDSVASTDYIIKVIGLVKNRMHLLTDFHEQAGFFFEAPTEYDPKTVKEKWNEQMPAFMNELLPVLNTVKPFTREIIETAIKGFIDQKQMGMGVVMNNLRLLMVGTNKGPGLADIMEMLGKEEVLRRIEAGVKKLSELGSMV
jgi:glutamyl-tRNA synthetase